MSDTVKIALNKLDADPNNVRKTYFKDSIDELAASLRAEGFQPLQNLVVRKGDKKGRFYVTAGERRRRALEMLAEKGEIEADFAVNCMVKDADDAAAVSLAENIMREDMHPADAFEAFKALADKGKSVAEIAARFGTTENTVTRRLALARVAPELIDLYREDEISTDQLKAFSITDDHARQVEVWNSLNQYDRHPNSIRRRLTEAEIALSAKTMRFIGVEAYEQAGGIVRRDLFSDNGGYATDAALVDRLVMAKLDQIAEPIRAEGWKWVECFSEQPSGFYNTPRIYPDTIPLSEEAQARLDQLCTEYDALAELIEHGAADDDAEDKIEVIEAEIESIKATTEGYAADAIARAGVSIWLDYSGDVSIYRGLLRNEDVTAKPSGTSKDSATDTEKAPHSAALLQSLTAHKTAALQIEMMHNSEIALVAVVHSLLLSAFYSGASSQSCLQITMTKEYLEPSFATGEECRALEHVEQEIERMGDHLPGNPADLWDWLMTQHQSNLLELMAFAAARSVNVVKKPHDSYRDASRQHGNQLACALKMDMAEWFKPTAANYFGRVSRKVIEDAVAEVKGTDVAAKVGAMKKAEAAAYAEAQLAESQWLPEPVRIQTEVEADQDEVSAAA